MAIKFQVLGEPGRDNALFVTVDTGQSLHRLLLDCGGGVLDSISVADIQQIEALFFSHFHFDHVAGFDSFFRLNWCRPQDPVRIFGPRETREVIHHRLQGVTWNLVAGLPGAIQVTTLDGQNLVTTAYQTQDGFREERKLRQQDFEQIIYQTDAFEVLACPLNHGTISLGYIVRERERQNIDLDALAQLGLKPGPWLQAVKDPARPDTETVETPTGQQTLGDLQSRLLVTQPGDSIAYLTDFMLDSEETEEPLLKILEGCRTLVCENNYADADRELAVKNFHLMSDGSQHASNRSNSCCFTSRTATPPRNGRSNFVRCGTIFHKRIFPKRGRNVSVIDLSCFQNRRRGNSHKCSFHSATCPRVCTFRI